MFWASQPLGIRSGLSLLTVSDIICNQMRQKTFIWMFDSDSDHRAYPQSTQCHTVVRSEAWRNVTMETGLGEISVKPSVVLYNSTYRGSSKKCYSRVKLYLHTINVALESTSLILSFYFLLVLSLSPFDKTRSQRASSFKVFSRRPPQLLSPCLR